MDAKKKTKPEEEFRIRTRLEILYGCLNKLQSEDVQKTLDIDYWQKRINKEGAINPTGVRDLQLALNKHKEDKADVESRMRITKSMIAEEKKKLSQEELLAILENIKMSSEKDMVKSVVDSFLLSLVIYEIDLKFWEARLALSTQPEVTASIETNAIATLKKSITNAQGGMKNALAYLANLDKKSEEEKNMNVN